MPAALPNTIGDVFTLTETLLAEGCHAAAASPRKRILLPLHRTQDALVQRMLNFLQPGTYIQPHLHPLHCATETIQVLRGALGFVIFNEAGEVTQCLTLQADGTGLVDIEPHVWHGFVTLEPNTVILEVKRGPYDGVGDKVFATWAPGEGTEGVPAYLATIRRLFA